MVMTPEHIEASPAMDPGAAGALLAVTASALADDAHVPLFAVTDISPEVVLAVASMEFVVDVPVQPSGNVHV